MPDQDNVYPSVGPESLDQESLDRDSELASVPVFETNDGYGEGPTGGSSHRISSFQSHDNAGTTMPMYNLYSIPEFGRSHTIPRPPSQGTIQPQDFNTAFGIVSQFIPFGMGGVQQYVDPMVTYGTQQYSRLQQVDPFPYQASFLPTGSTGNNSIASSSNPESIPAQQGPPQLSSATRCRGLRKLRTVSAPHSMAGRFSKRGKSSQAPTSFDRDVRRNQMFEILKINFRVKMSDSDPFLESRKDPQASEALSEFIHQSVVGELDDEDSDHALTVLRKELSSVWSVLKITAKYIVIAAYDIIPFKQIISGALTDEQIQAYVRGRVATLVHNHAYIYGPGKLGENTPFAHPALLALISIFWFGKPKAIGRLANDRTAFHPKIPEGVLLFAGAAIRCAIDEFTQGIHQDHAFGSRYKPIYAELSKIMNHLNTDERTSHVIPELCRSILVIQKYCNGLDLDNLG